MYNIADFLLVHLSLSRFTLIKSAQSSHVCLNYISTAQFYQSDNQNIIFFWLILGWTFLSAISANRNFFRWIFGKHSAANLRGLTCTTRRSADADNGLDAFSGQSVEVNKHGTIPHVTYSFLLCNSNCLYDIRLQKISWPWNGGQRSLKVIESDIIP